MLPFIKKNKENKTYVQIISKIILNYIRIAIIVLTVFVTILSIISARENAVTNLKSYVKDFTNEFNLWMCNNYDVLNNISFSLLFEDNLSSTNLDTQVKSSSLSSISKIRYGCVIVDNKDIITTSTAPKAILTTPYATRNWYMYAINHQNKIIVSIPDDNNDNNTIFLSRCVRDNDRVYVIMLNIDTTTLSVKANDMKNTNEDKSIYVLNNVGHYIVDSTSIQNHEATIFSSKFSLLEKSSKVFKTRKDLLYSYSDDSKDPGKIVYCNNNVYDDDFTVVGVGPKYLFSTNYILAIFICVLIIIFTSTFLRNLIHKHIKILIMPIKRLVNNIDTISKGNLKITFKCNSKIKEICEINSKLDDLKDATYASFSSVKDILTSINEGNLDNDFFGDDLPDFIAIKSLIASIERTLSLIFSDVNETGLSLAYSAEYMSESTKELIAVQNKASDNIVDTNTYIDNVVYNNTFTKYKCSDLSESFENICHLLNDEQKSSNYIIDTLSEIQEFQKKICQTTVSLSDISAQTDLLSLKASIEATKLGTPGVRLAKIALEIGSLAKECANTVSYVSTLSDELTNAVLKGIDFGNKTSSQVSYIISNITKINDTILEIKDSMNIQKVDIIKLSSNVSNLSNIVENSANIPKELDSISKDTKEHSVLLKKIVDKYNFPR